MLCKYGENKKAASLYQDSLLLWRSRSGKTRTSGLLRIRQVIYPLIYTP